MACCSFVCSRRTLSSSSLSNRALSVKWVAVAAGACLRACPSGAGFAASAGRFPGSFRAAFCVSITGVIMFISSYQLVTHPLHAQEKYRLLWDWLKFLPNPHDMSIHRPCGWEVFISPNLVEQPLAAQRFPG